LPLPTWHATQQVQEPALETAWLLCTSYQSFTEECQTINTQNKGIIHLNQAATCKSWPPGSLEAVFQGTWMAGSLPLIGLNATLDWDEKADRFLV